MAELKTKKTEQSVSDYLNKLSEEIRSDCKKIDSMMQKATGAKGKMWGAAIVGYGDEKLKYESGRELDWFIIGFSPRKGNITLYIGIDSLDKKALEKLGKYKTGKSCLYIKSLTEIDEKVLQSLITQSAKRKK